MQLNFKGLLFLSLGIPLLTMTALLTLLYLYDPAHLFSKPWKKQERFFLDMNLQAAGLTQNQDFDSILLGSSSYQDVSLREVNKAFGGKFMNFSIFGTNYRHKKKLFKYIKRNKGPLKTVLFTFDLISNERDMARHLQKSDLLYPYLYDRWRLNDFKLYLNPHYLNCLFSRSQSKSCIGRMRDIDSHLSRGREPKFFKPHVGLPFWKENRDPRDLEAYKEQVKIYYANKTFTARDRKRYKKLVYRPFMTTFKRHMLKIIKDNPKTEFKMLIPPQARLKFALVYRKPYIQFFRFRMLEEIVKMSDEHKNFEVYGYEDRDFLDNLGNYWDTIHFMPFIADQIIKDMSQGVGRITLGTFPTYKSKAIALAAKFDLSKAMEESRRIFQITDAP